MRIVIIGIDGVPFRLMETLSEKGVMPNFKKLKSEGIFRKMASSIPEISSVAWSSVITGKNPGEHGIYGFTDLLPGTYSMSFPNFRQLKAPAFWHQDSDKKSVIINVPSTYPAQELNGFLVSGFVSLDLESSVYPPEYVMKLEDMNYSIDVDSEKGHVSMDLFLKHLFQTHEARIKLCWYLWDEFEWDNFMIVFTGSDRLSHFLWNAYEDENHKYRKEFLEYFKRVDDAIGEINGKLKEDDALIMLSDHGFESVKTNVNINRILIESGLLSLEEKERVSYNCIKSETKAFALDPARIYVHKEGKYPKGTVKSEEETGIMNQLVETFKSLEYEGEPVIKKIFKKDEVYHGEYLDKAPDLVLLPNSGFSLRGSIAKKQVFDKDIFEGMHTQEDAFIFVKTDKQDVVPDNVSVSDVVDIMKKLREEE